jgi:hypothetical protein
MLSRLREMWGLNSSPLVWAGESGPKRRKARRYSTLKSEWHTCIYTASNGAGATNADTPALTDSGVLFIINNHFLFQKPMTLVAAYASGASMSRARLDSGNLRYYGNPYIRPFNPALLPGSNPNMMLLWDNPMILPAREEIAAQLSNTAGAPEREYLALFLMSNYMPATPGPFWAVRYTGSTAVVANTWTIEPFVLETALPSGTYDMIDLDTQSTNGIMARMFFDTQFYRPGTLMFNAIGNRDVDVWRPGILGKMNVQPFVNDRLPALEILANAADAAFEGYFYLKPASPPAVGVGGVMGPGATGALPYRAGA